MPSLTGRFDPALGPLLLVGVAPAGTIQPGGGPPTSPIQTFPALIDTGATSSCITAAAAQAVGLQPVGMRPMTSASHTVPTNFYLADLMLTFGTTALGIAAANIMEFNAAGGQIAMLFGRDLLCKGVFTLSFDGHFTFSI